jgi:glycosyltransferase involved in cell wall biosynthesis
MADPIITIAMPFYNSAATLELSIRSLLNQSYGDFELLLCDDGSDDLGLAIARSFDDPRVICWSDGRRLRLAARLNECIDRARGSYLARMDADDIAYPDRLARQLTFLGSHAEVDLCSAGALVFGRRGRPLWRFSPAQEHAAIIRSPFRGFPLWHPLWMGHIEWFRRWRYEETAWLAQNPPTEPGINDLYDLQTGRNGKLDRIGLPSYTGRTRRLTARGETKAKMLHSSRHKLIPIRVLQRLQVRLEKRMEALQRVKLAGYEMVISELEIEMEYLRRAKRYLED